MRAAIEAGGEDPYTFDCDGPTTVVTQAEIVIDNDVVLDGGGNLRVNADFRHRVISVAEGVTAELRGFEVTRGIDGAVANLGTLTLMSSTVSGNTNGGIWNGSEDEPHLEGTLTVTNSTVSENTGAGIFSFGTLTVTNSTVSENTEGGIAATALTLTNSTVSTSLSGAIIPLVDQAATLTVANSLIDGACWGNIDSKGYNIESPGRSCSFDQETDRVDVSPKKLKLGPLQDNGGPTMTHALLPGSLALDVIPKAMCEADEDQRGVSRPQGDGCDVGAFELEVSGEPDACHEGSLGDPALLCPCTAICDFEAGLCEEDSNAPLGEPCVGGICDGEGNCVECFADEQCGNDFNDCTEQRCDAAFGECVVITLANGTPCAGGTCQAGQCALTGLILPCNEQGIRNAIAAGGGPYTFDCDGPTVVTTTGTLVIYKDVILDGEGNLTVNGNGSEIVFGVGLCFEGAPPPIGGGTLCGGEVQAELHGVTVTGGGTGIEIGEDVTFTLTRSTVSENAGETAIDNGGMLMLTHSTVSGNAGIAIAGNGGTLTVTNSTVSGNTGDGIVNNVDMTLTLLNSTVSGNTGGGITNAPNGTLMVANSLVDGDCEGDITSNGYNIESPANTCGFDQQGDQPNVPDPMLEPLQFNGGLTETHALLPGSTAINRIPGDACEVDTDQRGVTRPQGPACDVGAFELEQ
jgi:hypothetical protein